MPIIQIIRFFIKIFFYGFLFLSRKVFDNIFWKISIQKSFTTMIQNHMKMFGCDDEATNFPYFVFAISNIVCVISTSSFSFTGKSKKNLSPIQFFSFSTIKHCIFFSVTPTNRLLRTKKEIEKCRRMSEVGVALIHWKYINLILYASFTLSA
jgi:hypothetical protein